MGEIPFSGEVHFRPHGSAEAPPRIGYVPQNISIPRDTPMSVLDLLTITRTNFPSWLRRKEKHTRDAMQSLENVHAGHLTKRKIGELSGGELQRVLLASALNPLPELLLLDEPVSGVDSKGLSLFYETICSLRREYDISIILVTHDLAAITPHADRMILLDKNVITDGTPRDVMSSPALAEKMGSLFINLPLLPNDSEMHGETK